MADGVIEQTERGFEDDVSPGKYPQFTSKIGTKLVQ